MRTAAMLMICLGLVSCAVTEESERNERGGEDEELERRTVRVSLQTPHPGFGLEIESAVVRDGVLHVLARVIPPEEGGMFAMVITEVSATAEVEGAFESVERYVVGRTWNWEDERVRAVESVEEFRERTEGGEQVRVAGE